MSILFSQKHSENTLIAMDGKKVVGILSAMEIIVMVIHSSYEIIPYVF